MFDINAYLLGVNNIRSNKDYVSNNYLSLSTLQKIAISDNSTYVSNSDTEALFVNDNSVWRLYFYMKSKNCTESLRSLLNEVIKRPLITECIGKVKPVNMISDSLCNSGFVDYTCLSRMSALKINVLPLSGELLKGCCNATPEDVEQVQKLLSLSFNKYVSHLPNDEYLIQLLMQNLVYTYRVNKEIAAVVLLERTSAASIYIYQVAVDKKYQGNKIGSTLLLYALKHYQECKSFTVWFEDKSTAAIHIYEKYGFRFDGLKTKVLIYS